MSRSVFSSVWMQFFYQNSHNKREWVVYGNRLSSKHQIRKKSFVASVVKDGDQPKQLKFFFLVRFSDDEPRKNFILIDHHHRLHAVALRGSNKTFFRSNFFGWQSVFVNHPLTWLRSWWEFSMSTPTIKFSSKQCHLERISIGRVCRPGTFKLNQIVVKMHFVHRVMQGPVGQTVFLS